MKSKDDCKPSTIKSQIIEAWHNNLKKAETGEFGEMVSLNQNIICCPYDLEDILEEIIYWREKAEKDWESYKRNLCKYCKGTGKVTYSNMGGFGDDYEGDCKHCNINSKGNNKC